jgi:D-alanyl-lipoteichoic acid acyltransferase DltB (MBOAT superfamily)
MLFNSLPFIFCFLPLTLFGFHLLKRFASHQVALIWIVLASLFFYGWWNPAYIALLLFSILVNYGIGAWLRGHENNRKLILTLGILFDLLLLAYYKYWVFFASNIGSLFGWQWELADPVLPLGISFFTFQQISYRMECYRGKQRDDDFLRYVTCVTFFPHLIAGPIVLYQEMMPQLNDREASRFNTGRLGTGMTLFICGLGKKILLADRLAGLANQSFQQIADDTGLGFADSWLGALSYTLQLYYDFSGYCDMAVGLAWLFGVRLPMNFFSPYKSTSIIEFWRRWHITLGRFLRDYLYLPLGGNRGGRLHQLRNLMITMVLGGLWHGAGWTFITWGFLHGIFLVLNHLWRGISGPWAGLRQNTAWRLISWCITFLCVTIAWVYFRSPDMASANKMVRIMLLPVNAGEDSLTPALFHYQDLMWLAGSFLIAILFPNTFEILGHENPGIDVSHLSLNSAPPPSHAFLWTKTQIWKPTVGFGILYGVVFFFIIKSFFFLTPSPFLYFNF